MTLVKDVGRAGTTGVCVAEMLELRNVLNIKEFSEKVEKGLKLVIGKVLGRFVFGKTVDLPPPQNF
jgi:hypothetical protein